MLRQKKIAQQQQQQQQQQQHQHEHGVEDAADESIEEQPWIELTDSASEDSGDESLEKKDGAGPLNENDTDDEDDSQDNKKDGAAFYDQFEYDEWTGRTRARHDRAAAAKERQNKRAPLIERMTMIVSQAKAFKGDWYMKNIYKFEQ
ncbi:hypothetical protein BG011_002391 [Mortierella polycephala]|uniref:Uncharacterized protein n=1 Tax=Mortierella polycephala TaxID=41804 RepID=A0A9P6PIX1_9FUNG|nr:hypothetical protein BG011_002391 [Mortierella polycephala]